MPLVSVKSTFSLLFWHKILIPNFKCYCHEGLCMSLYTCSYKNSLNLLGEKYLNESHWSMRRIRLLECRSFKISLKGFIFVLPCGRRPDTNISEFPCVTLDERALYFSLNAVRLIFTSISWPPTCSIIFLYGDKSIFDSADCRASIFAFRKLFIRTYSPI